MFSHIFIGTNDFERAPRFYTPLMKVLEIEARFCDPARAWAGWQSTPGPRPEYHPHDDGAYVQDPDGNKLAFACHEPE